MFSNLSSSSISFATVTPSFVIRGAPNDFSMTTLRPFGPRVTLTAFASVSTPRSIFSRASDENVTSLAAIALTSFLWLTENCGTSRRLLKANRLFDDTEDVALLHDEQILAVDLHLCSRPFAEQHMITRLQLQRDEFALFVARPRTDRDDLAFLRVFLGGVRNNDAANCFLLGF